MDVETFMRKGFKDLDSENCPAAKKTPKTKKLKKSKTPTSKKQKQKPKDNVDSEEAPPAKTAAATVSKHKAVVNTLESKDPEFYKFLLEEDKNLLNFDDSSDEEEEVHQLPDKLIEQQDKPKGKEKRFVNSSDEDSDDADDSDEDDSEDESGSKSKVTATALRGEHITEAVIDKWSRRLESNPRIEIIEALVRSLQGAVLEASGDDKSGEAQDGFKVEGQANFNAVVRACLRNFPAAFAAVLQYKPAVHATPASCKRWTQLKPIIRAYLGALLDLLKNLAVAEVINAVLKHITALAKYIACFPKQTRVYIKAMIKVWSTGEETSRVLSFLSLIRLVRLKQEDLLEKTLKAMYMAYVRNCKFTSPTLMPMISFMQHSLVEIFSLDKLLGYQYTFVYIRQLAIHLRNAMASKKKEAHQTVYNWQFIHSCGMFTRLVSALHKDENISQLIFPLIQIILGTIKLIPTARYYPLRFLCIRMLNLISLKTGIYTPSFTHVLEVLEITDFQKKISKLNTRPIDFTCVLKLSKAQTQDRAFKDGTMDQVYELIMDTLVCYSHTMNFPELVIPAVHQLKQFVKTCKVANFTKQMKQLLSKIEENRTVIELRRKSKSIDLTNSQQVRDWEDRSRSEGTPVTLYYKQYRLLRDREVRLELAGKERMEELDNTPIIPTGQRKASETEKQEFSTLFGSDDDDSTDDESRFEPKEEREKKRKLKAMEDDDDDISSLDDEEMAMLDKDYSGDDDSDDLEGDDDSEEGDDFDDDDAGDDIVEDLNLSDID